MADEDVATKAPESDVQGTAVKQPSLVSSEDTKAQEGPSMGEHCVTERPTPENAPQSSGEISKIADIDVYITKPSDYPHLPSKLLILLSNASGIHSRNNQLQADKFASEGFLVVMPDQFAGDALTSAPINSAEDEENPSMIEKVKMGIATAAKSFSIDTWLARNTPEKVLPILSKVIDGAKEEFADAVANGGGVYGVGYCFGGRYVTIFASDTPHPSSEKKAAQDEETGLAKTVPVFKAGAVAHGTQISKEELESIKSPLTFVCVENDNLFPDDIREAGKAYLEENKIEHELKVYPSVPHGFGVLGQYEDEKIQKAQGEAHEQMLAWLKSH